MKTLREFFESPPETRGHILVIRVPPPRKRRLVVVPVKVLEKSSEENKESEHP